MMHSNARRALDILASALDVAPGERDAFLCRECGEDATLASEVRSLLASSDGMPADFLLPHACPSSDGSRLLADSPDNAMIGQTIGKYAITNVIASGGMGTVYEGRQQRPQKTVALKVLRADLFSRAVARRFDHEAEVLARLRHPNVAQVFEAGLHRDSATGQIHSYFAMEHISGAKPIAIFVRESGLAIKATLTLFLDVCDGVQHGHQRGVIHRDLKPDNILVDDDGRVKIIDFGVARLTDTDIAVTTMHTEVGQLIGTLQYMSPEQCTGDSLEIDTRCDVYSLGVVLFELLTSRLPYDISNMTLQAAARIICEQPAERPSRFAPLLRGDLDAIILKALSKCRDDRYASVSDFACDLRAFMRGEPIQARPPTRWQRITVWAMRHPKATALISSIVILAGIVGGSTAMIVKKLHDFDKQPHRLVFDKEERGEATLQSRSGKTIKRWDSSGAKSITFAELYATPGDTVDTAYAIIGGEFSGSLDDPNGVNVFNLTGGKVSFSWADHVRDEDLPDSMKAEELVDFRAASFCAQRCWLLDVFPSRAGLELVVVFAHSRSRRMLAVYDVDTGQRLYRVWHDGAIESVICMPKPGLLLLAAEDARIYLRELGYDAEEIKPRGAENPARYPIMLIALRPEIGVTKPVFISLTEESNGVRPVWIKWVTPPAAQALVALRFYPNTAITEADTQVFCGVTNTRTRAQFAFAVDQDGHEVKSSRGLDDKYNLALGDAPEHTVFQLCDRLPLPGEVVRPGECPP